MTVIVLGVALLALVALLAHREREHDRTVSALLDRIQAPEAAVHAAYLGSTPAQPKPPDTDAEDDAAYGRVITGELDDLLAVGLDT